VAGLRLHGGVSRPWGPLLLLLLGCEAGGVLPDGDAGARLPESLFATTDGVHTRLQFEGGELEGKVVHDTREFLGIPYAKPPIGALRFAPPERAEPWHGLRHASEFGPACPHPSNGPFAIADDPMDEDCLTLNVYTPLVEPDALLPVMVFLHGGGFLFGASRDYDARRLSEAGPVVVVTLNYRLGPLGFFTLPALDATRPDAVSGDDGLRDQQLALRWVREHIVSFGGDPDNVTLFGHSTGSRSTCFQLVSPGSRGLAQRFIMQSDECIFQDAKPKQDNLNLSERMGKVFCGDRTGADVIACLRRQDAFDLVEWNGLADISGLPPEDYLGFTGWDAVVDGPNGALPDTAAALFASGQAHDGSLMLGSTRRENGQLQLLGLDSLETSTSQFFDDLHFMFGDQAGERIAGHYRPQDELEVNEAYIRLMTDQEVRCPNRELARGLSDRGKRVFLYSFDQGRAIHGDDVIYVMPLGDDVQFQGNDPAPESLIDAMQAYWTSFARDGDPNARGLPHWPQYDTAGDRHMALSDPPHAGAGLAKDDCDFWLDLQKSGLLR
jgi:para-nitrobenzyl esterase